MHSRTFERQTLNAGPLVLFKQKKQKKKKQEGGRPDAFLLIREKFSKAHIILYRIIKNICSTAEARSSHALDMGMNFLVIWGF